jgi:hypothetical protein
MSEFLYGFAVGNLVGGITGIAILVYLLDRAVKRSNE